MVTTHAHPGLVAITAGIPDAQGRLEFSSGLLIAPRLVLTSRHGVTGKGGVPLPGITVEPVTGPRGAVQIGAPVTGAIAWAGPGELDAALIELPAGEEVPEDFVPGQLAWGESIGTRPLPVTITGMPGFAASSTGNRAEAETARGNLEPGTYTSSDRYAVNLPAGWPHAWKDWAGMSGAAVTYEEGQQLVGVVAWSDQLLEGRRLTAVPVRALLADPGFCEVAGRHLGTIPELEPVELVPCLSRPRAAGSPGGLLRADAALVDFTGRDAEIGFLAGWRDRRAASGPDVKALLMVGRGGEGKTRLAMEFLARSKRDGWTGGLLRAGATADQAEVAAYSARPLVLVIDYAAARAEETRTLVQKIVPARPRVPVRLLLLARAAGEWWRDLAAQLEDDLPDLEGDVLVLRPLLADGSGGPGPDQPSRASVFTLAVRTLAPHLARFTGRTVAELRDLAVSVPVPDLSGRLYAHALTVQMTALVALLERCDPMAADEAGPEDTLLRHEQKYRDKLALGRRDLTDLRPVRDRAVAAAALFGARGRQRPEAREAACSLAEAALSPDLAGRLAQQRSVAEWIAEIYPPDDPAPGEQFEYWGTVLPDRLGEFLVVRLLSGEVPARGDGDDPAGAGRAGLLESLATRSDATGAVRALLILSRGAEHDAQAAAWIERLVTASPYQLGAAALRVAVYAENPAPLRSALVRLGISNRAVLAEVAGAVHNALPRFSLAGLEANAGLTRELTLVYRELTAVSRGAYLPGLAASLQNHSVRLAQAGRRAEALHASEEAVALHRELAAGNRAGYLAGLAGALSNHTPRLAEAGRWPEAVLVSQEAVTLYRELAAGNRAAYLPGLAGALLNRAAHLSETGQRDEAVPVSQEAVTWYRELAAGNRAAYLPNLASALNNHAGRLAETGQRDEAVPVSQEAVTLRRELAAGNRDAYLPDLANSLTSHAVRLAETGRRTEAVPVSQEAVTLYRELVAINRDAYLPDLATALSNHALRLAENGRRAEAAPIAAEAVTLRRELVAINRDAYLPRLAIALSNHALRLADAGHRDEAASVGEEAVAIYRELAAGNRDAYLPNLAVSLSNQASHLAKADRSTEAMRVSEETVTLRRELVAGNRAAYLPGLAGSLSNHAVYLAGNGQQSEAMSISAEAVSLRRELVTGNRAAYLAGLAGSLRNHDFWLAETGRTAAAAEVLAEAATLYRELASLDPAAYLPDLAVVAEVLSQRAAKLAETGQTAELLAASQQVVALRRDLAASDRATQLPGLAAWLNDYAVRLADSGQPAEAADAWEESVSFYRELTAIDQDAYLRLLAAVLTNWVRALADKPPAEVADVLEQTVAVYRRLVTADRTTYLPDLATWLGNYGSRLAAAGQSAEAASAMEETVTLYRELVTADRDTYLHSLAMSLHNYAIKLADSGRSGDALPVSEEATILSQQLAADNDEFLSGYLMSLGTYGRLLLEDNRIEDACAACMTAVHFCAQQPETFGSQARFAIATLRLANGKDPVRTDSIFRKLTGNSFSGWMRE